MGSETDKAAVMERRGGLPRRCLQVCREHRWPSIPPEESGNTARERGAFSLSLEGPQPRGAVCPDLKEHGTCVFKELD